MAQENKDKKALEKAKKQADEYMAQGYRKTSNNLSIISRVDLSGWKEQMAYKHAPWDIEEGRKWVEALGDGAADHYRRCYSKDSLTIPKEVLRFVKSSCHDPVGFISKRKVA